MILNYTDEEAKQVLSQNHNIPAGNIVITLVDKKDFFGQLDAENKLAAIKVIRERLGATGFTVGLKDAKDFTDEVEVLYNRLKTRRY